MRRISAAMTAVLAVWAATEPAAAQDDAPDMTASRDWSAALEADARALHAAILDSHPGVHDALNPGFRARVDDGLELALERAKTASDAGGWWWALRGFVAVFDDGHVQLGMANQGYGFPTRWPGFLTVYRGADQVVAERDEADGSAPPLGARLVDCDGVDAETLAQRRIGAFRGRWFLESQKALLGDWMFMNAANPWIDEMASCRFESGGEMRAYALTWRSIEAGDLGARRGRLAQRARPDFGMTALDDGGFWLSMPSFDGSPGGEAHRALTALLAEATDRQDALRAAPYVVLDLRGNGGGSSHWSRELAMTLWGEAWLRAHGTPPIEGIEWRASDDNLATVQHYLDEWTAAGESAERIRWAAEIVEGMTAARAAGEPTWFDRNTYTPGERPQSGPRLISGPVYVLTDAGCGSACLDAVDLWKAAGAVQIGRETSADTVYMDIREAELGSGLARLWIPMKVWRGRARGNNEPQRPTHLFDGDMTDQAALHAWVRTLD